MLLLKPWVAKQQLHESCSSTSIIEAASTPHAIHISNGDSEKILRAQGFVQQKRLQPQSILQNLDACR